MTPYTLSISIALITLIPLVASHPSYWVRTYRTAASGKCTEHPKFGYGPHSQRIFDDKGITFELTLDGKQQTEVCPGTVYNLEASFKTKREFLITSSVGMLKPVQDGKNDCPNRIFYNDVVSSASFLLTAPCNIPEAGVMVEVTSTDYNDLNYKYSSVTFHKGASCGPPPAGCPGVGSEF